MVLLAGLHVVSRDFSDEFPCSVVRVVHKISVKSPKSLFQVEREKKQVQNLCLYCFIGTKCKRNSLNDEIFSYQVGSQDKL